MNKFLSITSQLLFKFKFIILGIAFIFTTIAAYYSSKLTFNFSPDKIFLATDDAHKFFIETYQKEFAGLGTPCILSVSSKSESASEHALKKAYDFIVNDKDVLRVVSAFNQPIIFFDQNGIKPLHPTKDNGLLTENAKNYFKHNPQFKEVFFGKKDNTQGLVFFLPSSYESQKTQKEVIKKLKEGINSLQKSSPEVSFLVTGVPFIQHDMISLLQKDQFIFLPIVIIFIIALLLLMTKNILGALFPLITICVALLWTLGYLGFIGHEINVVNHSIMVLIIVIGIADSIHIYTRFIDEHLAHEHTEYDNEIKKNVLINTIRHMLVPCFLTTATTALGFYASGAAGVEIIQSFGNDTAVGVLLCYVATFTIMPAFLYMHPSPHKNRYVLPRFFHIDNFLRILITFSIKYSKALVISFFILLLIIGFSIRNLKSNQNWMSELPNNHPTSIALQSVEENFSGIMPFYIVFSGKPGDLINPKTFNAMSKLSDEISHHPLKPKINSITDIAKNLLGIKYFTQEDFQVFKPILEETLIKDEKQNTYFSKDLNHIRIEGTLKNTSTNEVEKFREFLERKIDLLVIPGVKINATGAALISARALNNIINDMTKSTLIAILYIVLFIALAFRSLKYGIVAILPNILPVVLTLAFLHWLNIDLRLATVMIFSMTLGISVDNCLHLLCRLKEEKGAKDLSKAELIKVIYSAFHGSGKAICYTTFILLGGFSIIAFSQFLALRDFAIISGITLLSALLVDIILLPAILIVGRRFLRL